MYIKEIKMFENQIVTLTAILKDKDIREYAGDAFWNIIKAISLGDVGALLDSSVDIKDLLFSCTDNFILGQNAEIYVRYL